MEIELKVKQNYIITTLLVNAKVRYWEDTEVNGVADEEGSLIPCRIGENWKLEIDIETGKIINWKQGVAANVHYKVCDSGEYSLLNNEGKTIVWFEGYVPKCMCPKDKGYGDYIIMDIDTDGQIKNWKFTAKDAEYFAEHNEE